MVKYIGGSNQSMGEKNERVKRLLKPLVPRDLGWRWQCYCGGWLYVKYRGRFYCYDCGSMVQHADTLTGKGETFRQAFERQGVGL